MSFKKFFYKKVNSTNDLAIRKIKAGTIKGIIIADYQKKGRGQQGKKWLSFKGNIFMTIFFKIKENINIKKITILNCKIIKKVLFQYIKKTITIKPPNDLLVDKKNQITDEILKMVSLYDKAESYSRSLSGGMKRRLLIAKAMVHQPPILILDEPTAGVDVELRKNLWENVKILNNAGVTIILTTHYLFEAQEMCNRIAIINKGNLVALDTTSNLLNRIKTKKITFILEKEIEEKNLNLEDVNFYINSKNKITITYEKNTEKFDKIISLFNKNNLKILDISTDDGDLEDVFVQLTKN